MNTVVTNNNTKMSTVIIGSGQVGKRAFINEKPTVENISVPHPPRPTVSIEADMQKLMAVPADKLSDMKLYAAKLRAKFPWMKPNRVKRKVAEYFKIKLT